MALRASADRCFARTSRHPSWSLAAISVDREGVEMRSAFPPYRTNAGSAERTQPSSEIDLLGELQSVINFDAEVANGALQLAATQTALAGAQVTGLFVDR